MNISLLLKWWWKAYCEKEGLWTSTIRVLLRRGSSSEGPDIWMIKGSFFWNQLRNIKHIFIRAAQWQIGDGKSVSFWFDAWVEEPIEVGGGKGLSKQNISLREAWPIKYQLLPDLELGRSITLTTQEDRLVWRGHYGKLHCQIGLQITNICWKD